MEKPFLCYVQVGEMNLRGPLVVRELADIHSQSDAERIKREYDEIMALPLADPRMNDDRREIHEMNDPAEDWSVQAFLLKQKAANLPLGKHFHQRKTEVFVILEGRVEKLVTAFGNELDERREFHDLSAGTTIVIPPMVAHTFYMQPDSRMICYSSRAFNPKDMDMTAVNLV